MDEITFITLFRYLLRIDSKILRLFKPYHYSYFDGELYSSVLVIYLFEMAEILFGKLMQEFTKDGFMTLETTFVKTFCKVINFTTPRYS